MRAKISLIFASLLLLAACAPKPVNGLPAINSSGTPISGSANVDISGLAFNPADITVFSGTTVTWTNLDSITHTVVADDNSWQSNNLKQGDQYSFTFTQPGVYSYHCSIHSSMKGTITVNPQ